jgi:cytidylate kinase
VSNHVARVGKHPDVRACVRVVQNEIANTGNVVVEGRDIGTVVFPQAECKFFLTANIDVRAERRYKEYVKKGIDCTIEGVREALIARDIEDESREHSPLLKAKDAIEIDTSTYTIEEELDMMEGYVQTCRSRS